MYCQTCRDSFLLNRPHKSFQSLDPASHYIFDVTRVVDHATHDFESLQKFKLEQRFNQVVVDEF